MAFTTAGNPKDDEISLVDLWVILREGWLLLAGVTTIGLIAAIIAGLIMTPLYRASTVIAEIESAGDTRSPASALLSQFGGLAGLTGANIRGLSGNRSDGRTVLRSRTFAEQFIREQELMPLLYSEYWNASSQTWNDDIENPPTLWQGANKFKRETFFFSEDDDTGLLTVAIEWPEPELAASWANRLIALANQISRERDIQQAESSIAYLQDQIEQTNVVELERVLYNLVEAEQKTLMLANAREDYVFQVVDPAVVPRTVEKPKRLLLAVLGTALGGLLGLILILIQQMIKGLNEQAAAAAN